MTSERATVTDRNGVRGTLAPGAADDAALVHLDDGTTARIQRDRLDRDGAGAYRYDGTFDEAEAASEAQVTEERRLPLAREEVHVRREQEETGRVRIHKHVHERTEMVDEPVFAEDVDVRRIPVDRVVDEPVPVRQDGDTTIVPIFEERLVVTRQLVLKEELHITRRRHETRARREVTLRSEEASVQREHVRPDDPSSEPPSSGPPHTDQSKDHS